MQIQEQIFLTSLNELWKSRQKVQYIFRIRHRRLVQWLFALSVVVGSSRSSTRKHSVHCTARMSIGIPVRRINDKVVDAMVMILLPVRLLQQETCLSIMIMDKDLESMSLAGKDGKRKREIQRNNTICIKFPIHWLTKTKLSVWKTWM